MDALFLIFFREKKNITLCSYHQIRSTVLSKAVKFMFKTSTYIFMLVPNIQIVVFLE
jgi:hypothetical protein